MEQMMFLSVLLGSIFNRRNGLIVALILGVLCFILIVSFIVLYFLKREGDTKKIIKKSINRKGQIYEAIRDQLIKDDYIMDHLSSHSHAVQSLSKTEIERIVQQKIDKALEGVMTKQRSDFSQDIPESTKSEETKVKSKTTIILYASCVDENRPFFMSVTTVPVDSTIFALELNPEDEHDATFTVYEKVYRKVIEEQGHLKGGCAIENPEMNTTTKVKTIEPGLAYCQNGEWVIKKQAKVKFE